MINGNLSHRVTLCFATVGRPHCVQRLISSIRKKYPSLPIIVADQSGDKSPLEAFYAMNGVEAIILPSDAGVSRSRNAAVSRVKTEYILLADDDFIIGPETDLAIPVNILDRERSVDILGGCLLDVYGELNFANHYVRRWERIFTVDSRSKTLISLAIDDIYPINKGSTSTPYFHCDAVMNWAVMRTNIFARGAVWDERFMCNGEHEDFYLNIKLNTDIRVGYVPDFLAYHHHPSDFKYSAQRNRQEGWRLFGEKWDLTHYYNSPVGMHLLSEGEIIFQRSRTLDEFLQRAQISPPPPFVAASFSEGGHAVVRGPRQNESFSFLMSNRGRMHFSSDQAENRGPAWPVTEFKLEQLGDVRSLSLEVLVADKTITATEGEKMSVPVLTRNQSDTPVGVLNAGHRIALGARIRGTQTDRSTSVHDANLTSLINDLDRMAYQYVNIDVNVPAGDYEIDVDFWQDSIGWLNRFETIALRVTRNETTSDASV